LREKLRRDPASVWDAIAQYLIEQQDAILTEAMEKIGQCQLSAESRLYREEASRLSFNDGVRAAQRELEYLFKSHRLRDW
jgi:hypothetical protein